MRARRCGGSSRTGGVTSVTTTLGPASRCCHPSGRTATRRRPGSVTRPYGSPGQGRDHTPAGLARRCHTPCPAALLRLPALSGRHGPDRDPGHARSCLDRHDHELRARPRNPHRGCLDQRAATRRRSSEGALLVNTDLPAALRTHAHGRPACEAAVELMLAGRRWLRRGDYVDGFIRIYPGTAAGAGLVAIDWAAAIGAAQTGQPPSSGDEQRILRLSASLAEGIPVDLRETSTGLDQTNLELVAAAVLHAGGHHPTPERQDTP